MELNFDLVWSYCPNQRNLKIMYLIESWLTWRDLWVLVLEIVDYRHTLTSHITSKIHLFLLLLLPHLLPISLITPLFFHSALPSFCSHVLDPYYPFLFLISSFPASHLLTSFTTYPPHSIALAHTY